VLFDLDDDRATLTIDHDRVEKVGKMTGGKFHVDDRPDNLNDAALCSSNSIDGHCKQTSSEPAPNP